MDEVVADLTRYNNAEDVFWLEVGLNHYKPLRHYKVLRKEKEMSPFISPYSCPTDRKHIYSSPTTMRHVSFTLNKIPDALW